MDAFIKCQLKLRNEQYCYSTDTTIMIAYAMNQYQG